MGTRDLAQDHGTARSLVSTGAERPTWAELEAHRVELEAEQEHLMAIVRQMEPELGARALRVLADKFEALEEQYSQMKRDRDEQRS